MSLLALNHIQESSAVDAAATKAIELVRELAEKDPHDDDDANPWRDPERVFRQLDQARANIIKAWEELHAAAADTDTPKKSNAASVNEEEIRAAYMDMITDAFADVLEDLRTNEPDDIDVDVLVDCLQSGLDLMSQEEKEFFMQDNEELLKDENESSDAVKPHELRRQQLGFNVEISSA
jgi:hypothetical protein